MSEMRIVFRLSTGPQTTRNIRQRKRAHLGALFAFILASDRPPNYVTRLCNNNLLVAGGLVLHSGL